MILVLNCGSQSIKWKLFNSSLGVDQEGKADVLSSNDFEKILRQELSKINAEHVDAVGHRVVHGANLFIKPTLATADTLAKLEQISHFAPLHNPYNTAGIKLCLELFKNVPQYAVFDTEFFAGLPEKAFTYALPENIGKEQGFKRYGFQGISHQYVALEAAKQLKKPFNKIKIITCHLGGGASLAAIKAGKAIDTTMGFTPLEGLVMMTRTGDIDAGIVLEMAKKYGPEKTSDILNKESGIKGICGQSTMLGVLQKIKDGDKKAKLALDVFVYSLQKHIGAYFAALGGCDALVFTGSVGSGSAKIRGMVCKNMDFFKKTKILSIQTDEELAIARKIQNI